MNCSAKSLTTQKRAEIQCSPFEGLKMLHHEIQSIVHQKFFAGHARADTELAQPLSFDYVQEEGLDKFQFFSWKYRW